MCRQVYALQLSKMRDRSMGNGEAKRAETKAPTCVNGRSTVSLTVLEIFLALVLAICTFLLLFLM